VATLVVPGSLGPDTPYTVRMPLPDLLVRGAGNTISVTLYRDGVAVAPSGGAVSIFDATNTALVDAQTVTVTGTRVTYTASVLDIPNTTPLGEGWRIEWTLVATDSDQPDSLVVVHQDAALIRHPLYPVITDGDLDQRMRGIDHTGRAAHTVTDSQPAIDEAWIEIQHRLINTGRRPNLIMSPSALRMPHLFLALAIRLDGLGPAYAEKAADYRRQYRDAWNEMTFLYDGDDDGQADSATERESGTSSVWLG
jgi:hypothetical protein